MTYEFPEYYDGLSSVIAIVYMNIFVPASLLLALFLFGLFVYQKLLSGDVRQLPVDIKARRVAALILPGLVSVYVVVMAMKFSEGSEWKIPYVFAFIAGCLIGYFLLSWLKKREFSSEKFTILSCLVVSSTFAFVMTGFLLSESQQMVSIVFGLLCGICMYGILHGFSNHLSHSAIPDLTSLITKSEQHPTQDEFQKDSSQDVPVQLVNSVLEGDVVVPEKPKKSAVQLLTEADEIIKRNLVKSFTDLKNSLGQQGFCSMVELHPGQNGKSVAGITVKAFRDPDNKGIEFTSPPYVWSLKRINSESAFTETMISSHSDQQVPVKKKVEFNKLDENYVVHNADRFLDLMAT